MAIDYGHMIGVLIEKLTERGMHVCACRTLEVPELYELNACGRVANDSPVDKKSLPVLDWTRSYGWSTACWRLIVREPSGARHGMVAMRLAYGIMVHGEAIDLGRMYAAETEFKVEAETLNAY